LWSWTVDGNTTTQILTGGDGIINMLDYAVFAAQYPQTENPLLILSMMAEAWLSTPASSNWSPQCDIDGPGASPTIELPVGEHTVELIVHDGIDDSEPDYVDVNVVAPLEADLWMFPTRIRRSSCWPRYVLAFITLPEGIEEDDIKDEKFVLYPAESEESIEATCQYVYSRRGRVKAIAAFKKADLMDAVLQNGWVELNVVGTLESGRYFYGSDTVKIIDWHW